MKSLSVSKLKISNTKSQKQSEEKSACSTSIVSVEVVLHMSSLISVVDETKEGSEGAVGEGGSASEDLANVGACEGVQVPVVGVVLDCFNALDFALHLFVALLEVVVVAVSVRMTVTSHDFNYYRALVI